MKKESGKAIIEMLRTQLEVKEFQHKKEIEAHIFKIDALKIVNGRLNNELMDEKETVSGLRKALDEEQKLDDGGQEDKTQLDVDIKQIIKQSFSDKEKLDLISSLLTSECTICLEEIAAPEDATLPCGHNSWHKHCIKNQLAINGKCPLCRFKPDEDFRDNFNIE